MLTGLYDPVGNGAIRIARLFKRHFRPVVANDMPDRVSHKSFRLLDGVLAERTGAVDLRGEALDSSDDPPLLFDGRQRDLQLKEECFLEAIPGQWRAASTIRIDAVITEGWRNQSRRKSTSRRTL